MKKILLAMMWLLWLPAALNAQDVIIDGIVYAIEGEEAVLSDGKEAYGKVVIPSEIEYDGKTYPVTAIADHAFETWSYELLPISSVEIPASLVKIGANAFTNTALTEIEIPESVKIIGNSAFSGCNKLIKAAVYGGQEKLGGHVFQSCMSLESFILGEGHAEVTESMFGACHALTSVSLPSSLKAISGSSYGGGAFYCCYSLQTIELPEGLTSIGESAFSQSGLTTIKLPSSIANLGTRVFEDCRELSSVKLPSSMESLPAATFYNCVSLNSIELPEDLISIEGDGSNDGCFSFCSSLSEVKLSSCLEEIGAFSFYGCSSLSTIEFPESLVRIGTSAFAGCRALKEIKIGPSLESIGDNCFNDTSSLVSIEVDASNKYFSIIDGILGDKEFTELILAPKSLSGVVTLPSSVKVLKSDVFNGCEQLTGLVLNNGLERIGTSVIYGCKSLQELTIPSTVYEIALTAFKGNSLRTFNVESGSQFYSSVDGLLTDSSRHTVIRCVIEKECMTLPESIVDIGTEAFSYTSIKEFICNEGLRKIGPYTFRSSALSKLEFSSTLNSIEEAAFIFCNNLNFIVVPSSVTELGERVFYGSGLEEITFTGGIVELPAFLCGQCNKLKRVDLSGIEKIGEGAFWYSSIDSIYLPESVNYIGSNAFCPEPRTTVKLIKSFAKIPPVLDQYAFGYNTYDAEVQVPESSLELYRNADGWKDFFLTGFDDVSSVMPTLGYSGRHWTVYRLDGGLVLDTNDYARVRTLTPGLYIVNGRKQIIR